MTQIEARRVFGIKIRRLISDHRFWYRHDSPAVFANTASMEDFSFSHAYHRLWHQIYSQAGRHSDILEFSKHHQFRKHWYSEYSSQCITKGCTRFCAEYMQSTDAVSVVLVIRVCVRKRSWGGGEEEKDLEEDEEFYNEVQHAVHWGEAHEKSQKCKDNENSQKR